MIALIASAGISILVSAFWNGQTVIRLPDTDWGMVILFGLCIVLLRKCKMNPVTVMFLAGILKFCWQKVRRFCKILVIVQWLHRCGSKYIFCTLTFKAIEGKIEKN